MIDHVSEAVLTGLPSVAEAIADSDVVGAPADGSVTEHVTEVTAPENQASAEAVAPTTVVVGIPTAVGPPGPAGPPGTPGGGEGGGVTPADLTAHINSTTPHPHYDDLPSLALLFENGLV